MGVAEELAAAGINIVLVARSKDKLIQTAANLKSRNPEIQTRIISADAGSCCVDAVVREIQDLDVSLLVNNVGVHNEIPANTEDLSTEEVKRIIDVNCTFQVLLTSAVLPRLKEFARNRSPGQGKPIVVNVSSLTSQMAMPLLSVYAATKAFEEHWTEGLGAELQPAGVGVLCLRPGLTVSAMSGETQSSLFCPTARTMAGACVRMLNCGQVSIVPYAPHAVLDCVNRWVPRQLAWGLVRDMHQRKRQALLAKRE